MPDVGNVGPARFSQKGSRVFELLPAISRIRDHTLRDAVTEIWIEAWDQSKWGDLSEVPKGVYADSSPTRPLVEHVSAVADGSVAFADTVERVHGWQVDKDILLAGALLHDTSKVVESEPDSDGHVVLSELGAMIQHGVWTAHRALDHGLPLPLVHMIVSHTPTSRSVPSTTEAMILYYIDSLDSDVLSLHKGSKLLLRK